MRLVASISAFALAASTAAAVGFDRDDFLVTSFSAGTIGVYNHDLTFKGLLESEFDGVSALTFDRQGNLVAAKGTFAGSPPELRVYDKNGTQLAARGFSNPELQEPADIDVAPDGHYYVAGQFLHVGDFTASGVLLEKFRNSVTHHISGVALLPGGIVWTGTSPNTSVPAQNAISINDQLTRAQIGSIALDHGQKAANFLYYSPNTGTVLVTDWIGGAIFERDTAGNFVRSFTAPGYQMPSNVTRGPGGDVFSLQTNLNRLYRWDANGNSLGFISLAESVNGPVKIVWAGDSVPEPTTILSALGGLIVCGLSRQRFSEW